MLEHAELIAKVRRGEERLVPESLLNEANKRIAELKSQLEHRGAAWDELKALARDFDLAYDGLYASHQLRRLSPAISPDLREKILAAPTQPIEKRSRDDAFEEPADDCPSTPPAPLSPRTLSFGNGEASTSSAKKVKTAAETARWPTAWSAQAGPLPSWRASTSARITRRSGESDGLVDKKKCNHHQT